MALLDMQGMASTRGTATATDMAVAVAAAA